MYDVRYARLLSSPASLSLKKSFGAFPQKTPFASVLPDTTSRVLEEAQRWWACSFPISCLCISLEHVLLVTGEARQNQQQRESCTRSTVLGASDHATSNQPTNQHSEI